MFTAASADDENLHTGSLVRFTQSMTISLNPYLGFAGQAREAFTFYQSVFGGELDMTTYAEGGTEAKFPEYLMHASLFTPDGFRLMGSDMHEQVNPGHAVTVNGTTEAAERLTEIWNGLAQGAQVVFPLGPAPWGGSFGQLFDQFGIAWMVAFDDSFS